MFFRNIFRTMFNCINPKTTDDSEAYGAIKVASEVVESKDSESEPDYTICTLVEVTVVQGNASEAEVAELPSWFMDFVEDSENLQGESEVVTSSEGQRDFMEYINDSGDEEYEVDSEDEESEAEADISFTQSEMEVADTLANFADFMERDSGEDQESDDEQGSEANATFGSNSSSPYADDSTPIRTLGDVLGTSGDNGTARARVYTRNPREAGLVHVFTVTSAPHPAHCNCGAPNCTAHIDRLFHILTTAMRHPNDEDFFREISSIATDTSMLPTQKVTWSVKENTIDWDLKAMCLCGVRDCKLKFGSTKRMRFANIYTTGGYFSEKQRKDMEKLEKKDKEMEEETMRNFIGRLEKQKKELEADEDFEGEVVEEEEVVAQEEEEGPSVPQKTVPSQPKPDFAPSPLTLWSGIPFARMDREQLTKSCSELTDLVKHGRFAARLKWSQVFDAQRWAGEERKPGGFVDMMMSEAERMEERVMHNEMMLQRVVCMMNFS